MPDLMVINTLPEPDTLDTWVQTTYVVCIYYDENRDLHIHEDLLSWTTNN